MNLVELAIPLGAFLTVALLLLAAHGAARNRAVAKERLARYRQAGAGSSIGEPNFGLLRERRNRKSAFHLILNRGDLYERLSLDLARAGLPLRVEEYAAMRVAAGLGLGLISYMLLPAVPISLVAGIIGFYLPRFVVSSREQARIQSFNDQLVDALALLANCLRSGYSLLQGMEAIARELSAPIATEFRESIQELSVGASAEDVLRGLTRRVRSSDLDLVITAMLIQRQVGGNLSEILETIATTIRERLRILREVRTLTAQERWSGYVIGALPIFLMVMISFVNRAYIESLFFTFSGQMMLALAAVLEVVGFLLIRRIVAIEV